MADGDRKIPPPCLWAQRKDKIYLTLAVQDINNETVKLEDKSLYFSAKGGSEGKQYEVTLEFLKEINAERSRRHKKIKDAARYDERKAASFRSSRPGEKINAAPSGTDDQEMPRSVKELIKFKENPSLMKRKRKKRRGQYNPSKDSLLDMKEKGMTVPLKPVPDFRQRKNESERKYMFRVEQETSAVLQKSDFEAKYKVDLDKVTSKDGGSIDRKLLSKKKRKEHQRLKNKKQQKKEKLKQRQEERQLKSGFEHLKDKVEFGEVVQAPPSLSSKPRKSTSEGLSRKPGKKALLLKDILAKNESPQTAKQRQVGESVKRKDQSLAQQRIMDAERDKAINLYRQMKMAKEKT